MTRLFFVGLIVLYPCCSTANPSLSLFLCPSLSIFLSGVWIIIRLFLFLYGGCAEAKYLAATPSFTIHGFSVSRWLQRTVALLYYIVSLSYIYILNSSSRILWDTYIYIYIQFRARETVDSAGFIVKSIAIVLAKITIILIVNKALRFDIKKTAWTSWYFDLTVRGWERIAESSHR